MSTVPVADRYLLDTYSAKFTKKSKISDLIKEQHIATIDHLLNVKLFIQSSTDAATTTGKDDQSK